MPWVQKDDWAEGERDGLFTSEPEIVGVLKALQEIIPDGKTACEVQILCPYNNQLEQIRERLATEKNKGGLAHMFSPPFDLLNGKRMGATVDEFQGSEADIVIVSLVRNNGLAPWKSVGFLKESNRMNVLLSRAKHKLIIVGSWEFFKTRCTAATSEEEPYSYLGRMMEHCELERANGKLARISVPK